MNKDKNEYNLPQFTETTKFKNEIKEYINRDLLDGHLSFCNALNCFFFPVVIIISKDGRILSRISEDLTNFDPFPN